MTTATVIDTPEGIAFARLATLKAALSLECKGLKMSRGRSAYAILKGMGYKGSKQKVLEQVQADVAKVLKDKTVEVGDTVRSYDFPGMHEDCYIEGVVEYIDRDGMARIAVEKDIYKGEDVTARKSRTVVVAPLGEHFLTKKVGVVVLKKAVA